MTAQQIQQFTSRRPAREVTAAKHITKAMSSKRVSVLADHVPSTGPEKASLHIQIQTHFIT